MREEENGLRGSEFDVAMDESFEACAQNASMLCIETVGGKVVSDYGISRGDARAILYGIGVYLVPLIWNTCGQNCRHSKKTT